VFIGVALPSFLAAALAVAVRGSCAARNNPVKPVRIVTSRPPGGGNDFSARPSRARHHSGAARRRR
jgi:tripartite-type tricarboxylate transporter receptor subunit TctC